MIVQFITSNFRALRQAADLSLLEANITEFQETLIRSQLDGSAVLPVSLLYGANGSGKSTVLEAIVYLKELISDPEHMMKKAAAFTARTAFRPALIWYFVMRRGSTNIFSSC